MLLSNPETKVLRAHKSISMSRDCFLKQVVSPTGSFGGCEGSFVKSASMLEIPGPHPSPHYPSTTSPPCLSPSPSVVHGSTPLSQIGASCLPPTSDLNLHQGSLSATSGGSGDEDDDLFGNRKKQKRGVLPKQATSIMRSWLFQHLVVNIFCYLCF
ncbi:Homeobox protein pknox2 [Homalodisca vitripennis]|nr:Homeobox protein pknox2 [Homalodisca vitripennis]